MRKRLTGLSAGFKNRQTHQSACNRIAFAGQTGRQAPHPVQRSGSTTGKAAAFRRGEKRIAAASQASPQLRHTTFCAKAMQLGWITARRRVSPGAATASLAGFCE